MTSDDSTPSTTVTTRPPRSPRAARTLLLSACAAGLTGLSLVGGVPGTSAAPAPQVLRSDGTLPAPILLEQRVQPRANRSRPLGAKKASAPAKVAAPVKKAAAPTKKAQVAKHVITFSWVRPSNAGIVSPYGPRWGGFHKGVDFGASYGAPIQAVGDGVVVGTGYQPGESGYGQITIIRHSNGYYSAYAHQSSMVVHEGDHVTAGELIGYVGSTGHSTGPHLHFEIRTEPHGGQINPSSWLRAHGVDV